MGNTQVEEEEHQLESSEREKQLKAFDDTKSGVKGLIDGGISKIPKIFIAPITNNNKITCQTPPNSSCSTHQIQIPVIDLKEEEEDDVVGIRKGIIEQVRLASETCGFFQVVNHGIPKEVMEEMIQGVRRFHEEAQDVKEVYYTRDVTKKVRYMSNFDLYQSKLANWRDTLVCTMAPDSLHPQLLPLACRDITILYSEHVKKLGHTLLELLSEALGLRPKHLEDMECGKGHILVSHYYPACPEPHKTMGTTEHSDPDFFTILLQDHIGGLQVLYHNQWLDVKPVEGALVINLGDLIQLISNDKFKSARHRVLANRVGPRISVACFYSTHLQPHNRLYGPIKELLSEGNSPLFEETTVRDYVLYFNSKGLGHLALEDFRL